MKNIYKSEQNGRSMIEMLGVLAIIGVLSVGGISGYSKAMAKFKVNKTLDQVSMLITNIRTMYSNQSSYTGIDNASIISFDLASQDMVKGTDLVNPFQGSITVAPGGTGTTVGNSFTVEYQGLDSNSCVTIASSDWGGAPSSGLVTISINDTAYSWGGTAAEDGTVSNNLPINLATAAAACNDKNGNNNKIKWEYR